METNGNPIVPQKSCRFSSTNNDDKPHEIDRNLSLGNIKLESLERKESDFANEQIIEEEEEGEKSNDDNENENASNGEKSNPKVETEPDFKTLSEEVDQFLNSLSNADQSDETQAPQIPKSMIDKFLDLVSKKIEKYENGEEKWVPELEDLPLLASIDRVLRLSSQTEKFHMEHDYSQVMNQAGGIVHRAMAFLEEELHSLLLEDPHVESNRHSSFGKSAQDPDRCVLPPVSTENDGEKPKELPLPYPSDTIERLHDIAKSMISCGYTMECCETFNIARRNAFEANLLTLGYEKPSIDDVVRMPWDTLEGEIPTWIKVFKHAVTIGFECEREIASRVFCDDQAICDEFLRDLANEVVLHLLNFPEAMFMTKRSAEKLFKMLDMYEALRECEPVIESLFPTDEEKNGEENMMAFNLDLKLEISSVRSHLGESTMEIFCDLERSIKADTGKTPVPGGAVHPLTRYVMNYLKYACEYKSTLEQIFNEHGRMNFDSDENPEENGGKHGNYFAVQLIKIMDFLNSNLEAKSKLYKDHALNYIFLMNNGRYIVQKIKGSAEINALIGETWGRNRSAELRQYHKSYQRETWSRILASLRNDGLMVKGSVQKPVLKERFKSFNALFEEIHKTQSAWVVSDEQLKSELRVSICAVVVPAYRSFKGRFEQHFTAGRQTEKYIKFSADDLEKYIEDLFEGNPVSIARRR